MEEFLALIMEKLDVIYNFIMNEVFGKLDGLMDQFIEWLAI